MSKKKEINSGDLVKIEPITDNQKLVFDAYKEGKNGFFFGCAGTGKTFVTLYQSLQDVLKQGTGYDKVVIVRSLIPTREIGFLPGDEEDKAALYQVPYQNMVQFMLSNLMKMPSKVYMIHSKDKVVYISYQHHFLEV